MVGVWLEELWTESVGVAMSSSSWFRIMFERGFERDRLCVSGGFLRKALPGDTPS